MRLVSYFSEPGIKRYGIKHLTAEKEKEKEMMTSAPHVSCSSPIPASNPVDSSLVTAPCDLALAWL